MSDTGQGSLGGGDWDQQFDVFLPVNERVDDAGATHVAHMRGNHTAYVDVLAEFVRTGADLSAPLRSSIEDDQIDHVAFALESIGQAKVESIERVGS